MLRTIRLIAAAPVVELLAVAGILVPGALVFFALDATVTARLIGMAQLALWTAPAAGFAACALGGWWVARGASAGHERNGLALGIAVALIDLALLVANGAPFGVLMVTSIVARVAGGYCGGVLAKRARYRITSGAASQPPPSAL
jgi:hypothetical protein